MCVLYYYKRNEKKIEFHSSHKPHAYTYETFVGFVLKSNSSVVLTNKE